MIFLINNLIFTKKINRHFKCYKYNYLSFIFSLSVFAGLSVIITAFVREPKLSKVQFTVHSLFINALGDK